MSDHAFGIPPRQVDQSYHGIVGSPTAPVRIRPFKSSGYGRSYRCGYGYGFCIHRQYPYGVRNFCRNFRNLEKATVRFTPATEVYFFICVCNSLRWSQRLGRKSERFELNEL